MALEDVVGLKLDVGLPLVFAKGGIFGVGPKPRANQFGCILVPPCDLALPVWVVIEPGRRGNGRIMSNEGRDGVEGWRLALIQPLTEEAVLIHLSGLIEEVRPVGGEFKGMLEAMVGNDVAWASDSVGLEPGSGGEGLSQSSVEADHIVGDSLC